MVRRNDKNRYANLLLVEGTTEKRAIPYLIGLNGVSWLVNDENENKQKPIVYIEDNGGGDTKIVDAAVISNELNVAKREILGLIVDADNSCGSLLAEER